MPSSPSVVVFRCGPGREGWGGRGGEGSGVSQGRQARVLVGGWVGGWAVLVLHCGLAEGRGCAGHTWAQQASGPGLHSRAGTAGRSRRGPTRGWRERAPPLSRRWKRGPEELLRSRRGDSFASSLLTTVAGSLSLLSSPGPGEGSLSSRADDRLCNRSCCAPPALQPAADWTATQPAAWGC